MQKSTDNQPPDSKSSAMPKLHLSRKLLLETLELTPSHKTSVQFLRSIVVSIVALIVNFGGSFVIKDMLHAYYIVAAIVSYCMGVLVNYYLSVVWVFANRKLSSKKAEFTIFVIINLIGLAFNTAIIAGLVEFAHMGYWSALTIATIIIFLWNFIARKKILY